MSGKVENRRAMFVKAPVEQSITCGIKGERGIKKGFIFLGNNRIKDFYLWVIGVVGLEIYGIIFIMFTFFSGLFYGLVNIENCVTLFV
jgi:hypothetical protein